MRIIKYYDNIYITEHLLSTLNNFLYLSDDNDFENTFNFSILTNQKEKRKYLENLIKSKTHNAVILTELITFLYPCVKYSDDNNFFLIYFLQDYRYFTEYKTYIPIGFMYYYVKKNNFIKELKFIFNRYKQIDEIIVSDISLKDFMNKNLLIDFENDEVNIMLASNYTFTNLYICVRWKNE
ncbi:MAG: hypothetical protein NZ839_00520 [Endomicrobia bacterium]|nr:hypothetical protein [Endomicrobiia bacterium]